MKREERKYLESARVLLSAEFELKFWYEPRLELPVLLARSVALVFR